MDLGDIEVAESHLLFGGILGVTLGPFADTPGPLEGLHYEPLALLLLYNFALDD